MPLISIIVTTYNRKRLLSETLNSILNQTFQDFELIVVDNFSNYDFFAFMEGFENKKIIPFQNQNNGIIAVNRNFGLKQLTGKYIAFCDDDDVWLPHKLEIQLQAIKNLEKSHSKILIHSNTILYGENRKETVTKKSNINKFEDFFSGNPVTYSSVLVSKSSEIIFDEDPVKRASEDANLWIELLLNEYKFELISIPLVRYRIAQSSASRSNLRFNYLRYLYVIIAAIIKHKLIKFNKLKFYFFALKMFFKYSIRSLQNK
jgi:teichuronic acid biosynthesis glycosyltransferase TuaG